MTGVTDGYDDILRAVDLVGHRQARLLGRQFEFRNDLPGGLVMGPEYRAAAGLATVQAGALTREQQ